MRKWEYSKALVCRKCPDLVDRKPRISFRSPGCKEVEVISEMQECVGRECAAFYQDFTGEPACKKYGGPIFIRSLDAVRRELAKEGADE